MTPKGPEGSSLHPRVQVVSSHVAPIRLNSPFSTMRVRPVLLHSPCDAKFVSIV
jgi:hypothetical protein